MHDLMVDFETVTPDLWMANEETWKEKLLKLPNLFQIPLINSNASLNLPDSTLVRFKGMIQDMHNPEFYFEQFEVLNTNTNEIKNKSGKYRDTAHILENEKINYTENLKSSQRQTMVVVSMPGLSDWAQQVEDKQNYLKHLEQQPNSSKRLNQDTKLKRSYEEAEEESDSMEVVEEVGNKERKVTEKSDAPANVVSREHLLNFPLPDTPSKSCIVKIYDDNENLKLNDMIEVVGFLSVDPALSGEFQPEKDPLPDPQTETEVETITHNPPPSLVPRLHAVYVKKLEHCNPLVKSFDQGAVLKEANSAREHLLKALTELLLGDKLAAEYLICHLIACVYLRQETLALGQFCLNLSNLPIQKYPNYAKQLYEIIKQFVTKSYYLPLTIENMNTLSLLPKKDYECNRLTSGVLQLSKDTHLVLDETKMEQGRLDATGVNNVAALGNMIMTQKVEYDFKYYKMEFDSDVSVLVLSEGKSLLPSDYHVPLRPEESSLQIFNAIIEAATYYLKEDIMNIIRIYLTSLKLVKYTISEDIQFVEDDFIEMRSNSDEDNPVTADDLHRLLVLARLVSLSRGFDTLDKECWEITKKMEAERLNRIKNRVASTI
ncbi:mini-chromosome maintenance complex-binding protein-like [Trichoplusia ni]|uniref:Mini-chromosome maintenance complex-binding protein n=2 Tax=Trichoplusia ni TaxID=7111 RepID=A0A7E5VY71_TRINI|nr:mini-chromosome maintenance complex-binding protein-like [Trichoplusia ni]